MTKAYSVIWLVTLLSIQMDKIPMNSINHNPFKPEFTIVIFIYYNSGLVVAEADLKWVAYGKKCYY